MEISKIIEQIRTFSKENNIPIVRPTTGEYLQKWVSKPQVKNILEIGTGVGYSGILMLDANKDANLTTIELKEENFRCALENFKKAELQNRAEVILGDAKEVLQDLIVSKRKFDFIFLDGPKAQYVAYLEFIKKIMADGCILFADNVLFFGMVKSNQYPHKKKTIVVNLQKYLLEVEKLPFKTEVFDIEDGFAISLFKG